MDVVLITNTGMQKEIEMPVIPRVGDTIYTEDMPALYAEDSQETEFWKVDEVRFCIKQSIYDKVIVLISNLF